MNIPTNLNPNLVKKIDKLAEDENRSRNNMIETLLLEAVKTREKITTKAKQ